VRSPGEPLALPPQHHAAAAHGPDAFRKGELFVKAIIHLCERHLVHARQQHHAAAAHGPDAFRKGELLLLLLLL